MHDLSVPEEVKLLLDKNVPVALGCSGGKDSVACALALSHYLKAAGHTGPQILVHADLGIVEWTDSGPSCQRVAEHIKWPLHVTRRAAGGMMERWESRWASSIRRYEALECVKLILPWSTPSMRFCTSELKSAPIASYLKKQFGKQPILSVTGIRADESAARAKQPVSKANTRLPTGSLDWNPIIRWSLAQVFSYIQDAGLQLHEAYTLFGSSRVSCCFCIMSKWEDLKAGLRDVRNHQVYHRMCSLELTSRYAFQSAKWLSSLDPCYDDDLLDAMRTAAVRDEHEARIPKHMLFTKGWPNQMPTEGEAEILAEVRSLVSKQYGFKSSFLTGSAVLERYAALLEEKAQK